MTLDFGYSSPKQGLKKKNKSDPGKKKNLLWKFLFQPEGWEFWGQKAKSRLPGHLSQEGQLSRHTFRVDSKGGFPVTQMVKSLPAMWETQMWPLGREDPWRRKWPSPQYSCLENPMDRGAWWAPVGSQRVGCNWGTKTQTQSGWTLQFDFSRERLSTLRCCLKVQS